MGHFFRECISKRSHVIMYGSEKGSKALKILQWLHHSLNDSKGRKARPKYTQVVLQVEHDREERAGCARIFKKVT
jgi:hypothetical protein